MPYKRGAPSVVPRLISRERWRRAAYNKAQRLPERRRMMQAWSDYLDELRSGANVVPFKRMAG
jgi:hypothetical protein